MSPTLRSSLFRTLHEASRYEVHLRADSSRTRNHQVARRLFVVMAVLPFVLALALIAVELLLDQPWLRDPSLAMLVLSYLGVLAQPLVQLVVHRRTWIDILKHPFGVLLHNAELTTIVDARYLPEMEARPLHLLELVHLEVKGEKEFFERRIALVVGAIDKVGLAPGLLAAVLSASALQADPAPWWQWGVLSLAYATPALYVFGVMAHHLAMRLDRIAKLLELAIARKRAPPSPIVETPHAGRPTTYASAARRLQRMRGLGDE